MENKIKRRIADGLLLAGFAWEFGFVAYGINTWTKAEINYRREVNAIIQQEGQYDRFKHEDIERKLEYASCVPILGYYGIGLAGALTLGFSGLSLRDRSKKNENKKLD